VRSVGGLEHEVLKRTPYLLELSGRLNKNAACPKPAKRATAQSGETRTFPHIFNLFNQIIAPTTEDEIFSDCIDSFDLFLELPYKT